MLAFIGRGVTEEIWDGFYEFFDRDDESICFVMLFHVQKWIARRVRIGFEYGVSTR